MCFSIQAIQEQNDTRDSSEDAARGKKDDPRELAKPAISPPVRWSPIETRSQFLASCLNRDDCDGESANAFMAW